MIRTNKLYIREYDVVAYRRKHPAGGVTINIVTPENKFFSLALFNSKSPIDQDIEKAVLDAAISKTKALPYYVVPEHSALFTKKEVLFAQPLKKSIVNQFDKFIDKFTDRQGVFNQQQLNLNLIQFSYRSNLVSSMINTREYTTKDIVKFILKTRAVEIAKIPLPSENYVEALMHILDELCQGTALGMLQKSIVARTEVVK